MEENKTERGIGNVCACLLETLQDTNQSSETAFFAHFILVVHIRVLSICYITLREGSPIIYRCQLALLSQQHQHKEIVLRVNIYKSK